MQKDYSSLSDLEVTERLRQRMREAIATLSQIDRLLGEIAGRE
ncbi:MAG: hypothetical protein PXX82_08860 [Methanomassiliicoccales archaeon]|nr:hypothetical protein [Methanomassiliicoccales archaeon]